MKPLQHIYTTGNGRGQALELTHLMRGWWLNVFFVEYYPETDLGFCWYEACS